MNPHVACGAVLLARVGYIVRSRQHRNAIVAGSERSGASVAFQADREDYRTLQQSRIGRSMRRVTRLAAIHANRGVLESKRTALIHVAFQTGLFVTQSLRNHSWPLPHSPGWRVGSMRVVA